MTLRDLLEELPPTAHVPVEWVLERLELGTGPAPPPLSDPTPATWREKLWTVPPETRIGVVELAEAVDRSRDWVYRHTSAKAGPDDRLPHRKLDGELVFVVEEIRSWIRGREDVIHLPPGKLRSVG